MALRIPLSPGVRAGEYEIIRMLSESGGSALVYYARKNDRLYVLKELYPAAWCRSIERSADGCMHLPESHADNWANRMHRFETEAQNYAQLQREFARDIIPGALVQTESAYTFFCEGMVSANGTCYLPIATSSGETLYSYALKLRGGSRESGDRLLQIFEIMIALCSAVLRLHELNRLHLDLKPDNLFMTDGQLKLLDFGSMAVMSNPQSPRAYTPGFSAPELDWGEGYLDAGECIPCAQSDVFSICAIFYWMLFGEARDQEDMYYEWELNLSQLTGEKFPALLTGCSLSVIEGCLNLLQKGMSVHPHRRHESIARLKAEFESLHAHLSKELSNSAQRATAAEFMSRVHEVYAFRCALPPRCRKCIEAGGSDGECLLTCRLMNRYIDRKVAMAIPLIVNETPPNSCIEYVHRNLIARNRYDEALFTLLFLDHRANTGLWHRTPRHSLYLKIAECAALLGRNSLADEYLRRADECRDPDASPDSDVFFALNIHEAQFSFGEMVECSRSAILERWGDPDADSSDRRSAVLRAILSQSPAPKTLVSHAGRYVEGLCLARSEGWKEDCEAILTHLLQHTDHVDEGFRARTVDNMLHYCIEADDHKLFLQTLPLMPQDPEVPESLLRPSGGLLKWSGKRTPTMHVEDWLIEAADRFSSGEMLAWFDSYQYIVYLYLQSVNAFFGKYLTKPHVALALGRLCSAIDSTLKGMPVQHPKELILKHAALIALGLGKRDLANSLRAQLVRCILGDSNGVVRVISGGALLAVDRAMGGGDSAFDALTKDIRGGIRDGIFRDELFRDSLSDGKALLRCFRFKHT